MQYTIGSGIGWCTSSIGLSTTFHSWHAIGTHWATRWYTYGNERRLVGAPIPPLELLVCAPGPSVELLVDAQVEPLVGAKECRTN